MTAKHVEAKVYCKDCHHHFEDQCCWAKINKFNNLLIKWGNVRDNDNGDCKNYKRKWWKFWVSSAPEIENNGSEGTKGKE